MATIALLLAAAWPAALGSAPRSDIGALARHGPALAHAAGIAGGVNPTLRAPGSSTTTTRTATGSSTETIAGDDNRLRPSPSALRPVLAVFPLPEVISHGDRSKPLIALTFDSNMTVRMLRELDTGHVARFVNDRVLGELRAMQVPATFFLSGLWVERYPDVAASIAADPLFEVGSHSFAHLGFRSGCYDLGRIDLSRAAEDVAHSEAVLDRVAPNHTRYFRFPGGCYDATALAAIRAAQVQVVQYDVASGDAFGSNPSWMVASTLASARNGSIVVLHITGGNKAPFTDRALPAIVDGLRARGFTLVTLSQLLAAGPAA